MPERKKERVGTRGITSRPVRYGRFSEWRCLNVLILWDTKQGFIPMIIITIESI